MDVICDPHSHVWLNAVKNGKSEKMNQEFCQCNTAVAPAAQFHLTSWTFFWGGCYPPLFFLCHRSDARCKWTCIATFKLCNWATKTQSVGLTLNISKVFDKLAEDLEVSHFRTSFVFWFGDFRSLRELRLLLFYTFLRLSRSVPIENWLVFYTFSIGL